MAIDFRQAFPPSAFALYWENAYSNQIEYLGSRFFGTRKKMGLDLSWIKGASGLPASLMPSTFDAKAKFRDHIGFSKEETEMPFFREGYLIKEKDRQELMRAQDTNDPYAQAILDRIYDGGAGEIEGARVVRERQLWQLMAPESGNAGINFNYNGVDYSYNYDPNGTWKANNYIEITTASEKWSAPTTANPIKNLQAAAKDARNRNGNVLTTAIMSDVTFGYLLENEAIRDLIISRSGDPINMVFDADIQRVFATYLGLNIVVYLKRYKDETGTIFPYYPDNYVTLVPSGQLGTMWFGTTPEEADLMGSGQADVSIVDTGVAVSRIIKPHPVNIELYVSEICLPSFERMDDVYVMKVA